MARGADDKGHARGLLIEDSFLVEAVGAGALAVVGSEDDQRVLLEAGGFERSEDLADLGVDFFDEAIVAPAERLPHLRIEIADGELRVGVIARTDLGHGVGLIARWCQIRRRGREFFGRRRFADGAVVQLLIAREFADVVGIEKTDDEEEGLVVFAGEKLRGQGGVFGVDVAGFEGFETVGLGGGFIVGEMPLAEVGGLVAGLAEMRPHRDERGGIERRLRIVGDAGLVRIATGKDRVARRHAERVRRVGAAEKCAARRQAIQRGRLQVAVTHPAAQRIGRVLVSHDENDVRRRGGGCGQHREKGEARFGE